MDEKEKEGPRVEIRIEGFDAWLESEPDSPLKMILRTLKTGEKTSLRFEIQPMGFGWS